MRMRPMVRNPIAAATLHHRLTETLLHHLHPACALGMANFGEGPQTTGGGMEDDPPVYVNTRPVVKPPTTPTTIGIQILGCAINTGAGGGLTIVSCIEA